MQNTHKPIALPTPIAIPSAPILAFPNSTNELQQQIPGQPPNKKRKKERACDYCRRRKIKCDGPWRHGQICTNCVHGHRHCTYLESSKPRCPPKAYVTALEDRMERLEELIKQRYPNTDFSQELGPAVVRGSWKNAGANDLTQSSNTSTSQPSDDSTSRHLSLLNLPRMSPAPAKYLDPLKSSINQTTHLVFVSPQRPPQSRQSPRSKNPFSLSSSEDSSNESSEETIETGPGGRHRLTLSAMENVAEVQMDSRIRFHGRSSTAGLVEVTRKFRHLCMQERSSPDPLEGDKDSHETGDKPSSSTQTAPDLSRPSNKPDNEVVRATRRFQFWSTPKWEFEWESHNVKVPQLISAVLAYFPPDNIANHLFDLFFEHTNTYVPLLHRPTFESHWRQRLHHSNIWFATVCTTMFAVASRWYESGDEPVDNPSNKEDWKAIGWKWFFVALDVHRIRHSVLCSATLFEVQTFILMALFLRGTTCGPIGWLLISIGMRKAQDRGAHRRKVYKGKPNADDELWKRAFWILLAFDRVIGASLGRGAVVGEEDYDVDLPLETDDEYWETGNPETNFKQPPNIPSKICCFNQFVKLTRIIAFVAKTLYPINKDKVFYGFLRDRWVEEVIRQLKTAMDEWIEVLPAHLRWSEDIPNLTFARQSATIHALYYIIQITIWRQFCLHDLPTMLPPSAYKDINLAAIRQCAISAKKCARILDVDMQSGTHNTPVMLNTALVCAATVATLLWELQRRMVAAGKGKMQIRAFEIEGTGIYVHDLLDYADVCMRVLESKKSRWEWAEAVLNKMKDALPSDRDEIFENLDIPMESMEGIKQALITVKDFTFHSLQDGKTLPMDEKSPRADVLQAPLSRFAEDDCPKQAADQYEGRGPSSQQQGYHQPSTSNRVHLNRQVPYGPHLRGTGPQPSVVSATGFEEPINQGSLDSRERRGTHLRFIPHNPLETAPSSRFQQRRSLDYITSSSRAHTPHIRGSGRSPVPESEMFLQSGDYPLRDGPSNDPFPFERVTTPGAATVSQLTRFHPRTRTTSLVDTPFSLPSASGKIPSVSNFLRRTSFPNLQRLSRGDQTSPAPPVSQQGVVWPLQANESHPHLDFTGQGAPTIQKSIVHSASQPSLGKSKYNPLRSLGMNVDEQCRTADQSEEATCCTPNDDYAKSNRPTEFRHWNKLSLPSPPDPTEVDNPHYTQHHFIHGGPFRR